MEAIKLIEQDNHLFMYIPRDMSLAQIRGFIRRLTEKLRIFNLMNEKLLDVVYSTGYCWMAFDIKKTADAYGESDTTYLGFFGAEDYEGNESDEGFYKLEYEDIPVPEDIAVIRDRILEELKDFCGK